ncbi:Uncharacterized protein DBV15_01453 [Temnothorax longispinosus]|uniref:Uncharacterized protein n=1 Tax=Temnothorax longispinosus TaxID=300112 RepID=A0A4S2KU27_9HYME|nr:Uncharacterized protein DBV15_01453 [Temnothorax longispinosus]
MQEFVSLHFKQDCIRALCKKIKQSSRLRNLRGKLNLHADVSCIFQLVYCLTIGAYGRDGDLVLGLTAALAWELPSKVDSKISNLLHRRSRSVVYPKMEAFLQSAGFDGRSCVMRALCEAGQRDPSRIGTGSFVQELLHAIFT